MYKLKVSTDESKEGLRVVHEGYPDTIRGIHTGTVREDGYELVRIDPDCREAAQKIAPSCARQRDSVWSNRWLVADDKGDRPVGVCPDCDGKQVAAYSPHWVSEPCRTCNAGK